MFHRFGRSAAEVGMAEIEATPLLSENGLTVSGVEPEPSMPGAT